MAAFMAVAQPSSPGRSVSACLPAVRAPRT
jgi:hypothetical protein